MQENRLTGDKLKEWRVSKGWKRPYLAREFDISVTTLWEWEKSPGPVSRLAALAARAVDSNLKPLGE